MIPIVTYAAHVSVSNTDAAHDITDAAHVIAFVTYTAHELL